MMILVTGAWTNAHMYFKELEAHGHHVLFLQQERENLPCDPKDIEGIICNSFFLYHDIKEFTSLRYIQLTSAGYDRVPMDYIKKSNIQIHNAKGVYSIPMAEHVISGVLGLYRKAYIYHDYQKSHIWKKERDLIELNGKNILIIGCGSVGNECAKRFKAFNTNVVGIDPYVNDSLFFDTIYDTDKLDECLDQADIVVVTVPLTEHTVNLVNKDKISQMKQSAVLVNISRGKIVDNAALIESLKHNKLYGAVLDVFDSEPLNEESSFWDMENVILTPHVSYIGDGMNERLDKCILSNIDMI